MKVTTLSLVGLYTEIRRYGRLLSKVETICKLGCVTTLHYQYENSVVVVTMANGKVLDIVEVEP